MGLSPQSAEIMARLNKIAPQLLQPQPRAARGSRQKARTGGRREAGRLAPETSAQRSLEYGRRRMSPYQAKALGSGRGVLPARDSIAYAEVPPWFRSPQDYIMADGRPSFSSGHGRPTFVHLARGGTHITFPEWVV